MILSGHIKEVLKAAIEQGGTTLRDFVNGNGEPGYFQQTLAVYGRGGQPCTHCETLLKEIKLGQRSSVFCPSCQR
jgi:formamidopyrimidine-DNA glycosylase